MRLRAFVSAVAAIGLLAAFPAIGARAAEVDVLASIALTAVMKTIVPDFERSTGNTVTMAYQASGGAKKRIEDGAVAPDVAIVTDAGIADLIKQGKVATGSQADIARFLMGVAVRAGAAKPDISWPEALKRALLEAKSIAYTDPTGGGASGILFAKVLERLGIADAVKAKTQLTTRPVGELVAKGDAELGIAQIAELKSVPGVDIAGPLPGDLQPVTILTAGVLTGAKQPAAAAAFIKFLASPAAVSALKAAGIDPG